MLLWSCDTGTDLMVTYQRPLDSAPPTLRGPFSLLQLAANTGQGTACCAQGTQTVPLQTTYRNERLGYSRTAFKEGPVVSSASG